ncbi:MAG: glycosyltransferase family 2 protein [Candidatus Omnitrophica bacterium]|nr:glycosyltransferase family 2 protein [Candidatus Omnitrophota bacterium]
MNLELSIIVAVYSETDTVVETIRRLLEKDQGYIKEILLLVSPRSSAVCLEICRQAASDCKLVKFLIQEKNPGQGFAFRQGFDVASGTHVAIMSADLETEPEAIDRMVRKLIETNCDVVSASRWHKEGGFTGYGLVKMWVNYLFQRFFMFLFRTSISDLTYGLKLFRADLIKNMPWECAGHDLCLESILKMIKLGAHIEEVPTQWIKRCEGKSKNNSAVIVLMKYLKIGLEVYFSSISQLRKL